MAIDKNLELGTPEAAVRSCVELMSMLFEQPTEKVAYYLDLYYQVRRVYETEKALNKLHKMSGPGEIMYTEEPDPDVYPEPRRTMNEVRAPEVEENTSSGADAPPSTDRAPSPQGEGKAPPPGAEEGAAAFPQPHNWRSVAEQDRELHCGKAGKGKTLTGGEKTEKAREEKFREVLDSVNAGLVTEGRGSKSYGNHNSANAAKEKRRIRERLLSMREAGLSTPQIIKAADGNLTHEQIHAIIGAQPVPIAVYRVLDGALETLAGAAPER